MKKYIIVVIAIIVIVMAGAGVYFITTTSKQSENITNSAEKAVPQTALLTVIDNNVQLKETADAQFKDVTNGTTNVNEGAHIKTSLTGRAIIESENQTTTVVDKNSEFTIPTI